MQLICSQKKLFCLYNLPAEHLSPKGHFRNILFVFVVVAAAADAAVYFFKTTKVLVSSMQESTEPPKISSSFS